MLWKPRLKLLLKWLVPCVTLVFLGVTLGQHWQQVQAVRLQPSSWLWLGLAWVVTSAAFVWSGWLWASLFGVLGYPIQRGWATRLYLITNLAKYLPSNVLHFYARVQQTHGAGVPLGLSLLIVTLEPLLMVMAGVMVIVVNLPGMGLPLQLLCLGVLLVGLHPRWFNLLLQKLTQRPATQHPANTPVLRLKAYPFWPCVGELVFVSLRAVGFLLTLRAFTPIAPMAISPLLGAYCFGWVLGMVTPGAPGGMGVFELSVMQVLTQPQFAAKVNDIPVGTLLAGIAVYRLVSMGAEVFGAGLAWCRPHHPTPKPR